MKSCIWVGTITAAAILACPASAQRAEPKNGQPVEINKDSFGRACIQRPAPESVAVRNSPSNLFEHSVRFENVCTRTVRVEVCYRGSSRCKTLDVGSRSKAEVVLGFAPRAPQFEFTFSELKPRF